MTQKEIIKNEIDGPFKKGEWLVCINRNLTSTLIVGNIYRVVKVEDNTVTVYEDLVVSDENPTFTIEEAKQYFRPATEDEIPNCFTQEESRFWGYITNNLGELRFSIPYMMYDKIARHFYNFGKKMANEQRG